jgi:sugar fermentation stimulation protein A
MMMSNQLYKGTFVERPNRFIAHIDLGGNLVRCHMPNPGRMWELLFPGVTVYLRRAQQPGRKTDYDVIGIERDGVPILLDTQYNNDAAARLISEHRIPGWEQWDLLRREVTVGPSRFDLLLGQGEERFYVEVKSCTLFSRKGAMFPDAVTERGRRHVLHLADMAKEGCHAGVLFMVQWERAQWFLPDYHTDPDFASAFADSAPFLDWKALVLRWDEHFSIPEVVGTAAYPQDILLQENHDSGDYMVVLQLAEDQDIIIGAQGLRHFPAGYYVYVGSARRNLAARLARHTRRRKQLHWHIDYLRQKADVVAVIPIRTAADLEHCLAQAVAKIADWQIDRFGCTDCSCSSHLFGFTDNPIHQRDFMQLVEDFRMNRLDRLIGCN